MTKEVWLNIYDYKKAFIFGSDLYATPQEATKNLADKEHYKHTINVLTGEIKVMELK